MGQYHKIFNLDKREFINPHDLGCGLKVWEQLANHPGTGAALIALMACPEPRGGGDLAPDPYMGRWHGDRVVMIGDYADAKDIKGIDASAIYNDKTFVDITAGVAAVLERELEGKYVGDGWKDWQDNSQVK